MTDAELIGGPEHRPIVIAGYSDEWPRRFEAERDRIRDALGSRPKVEHVGSTAVRGLAAKPIIDIQVSVDDVAAEHTYVPLLQSAGYLLRVREHEHRMLRTAELDVHVHVCSTGSGWERRHLLLRDWLRVDADDRRRYEALKRTLAQRSWPTMNHYADAKSELIAAMIQRAEVWARSIGWRP